MNKKTILVVLMLALVGLFAYTAFATGVFVTRTPATLFQTTNTTINFSIVVNSTNINLSKNMTIYLMISNNTAGDTYNSNVSTFNLTNNVTNNTVFSVLVPGFNVGFHSWFVNIDDEHIEGDLNTYVDIAGDNMTGNLSFNTSAGANSYVMSNGSFITDVCFQNGTNCDGVFGYASMDNHSNSSSAELLLGEETADINYTNGLSWNGTHFQTGVNGSYMITSDLFVNSTNPLNYTIAIKVNGLVVRFANVSSVVHTGVSTASSISSASLTYVGCVNRGQNISVIVDSTNALDSLQLLNASSLTIERKSER